MEAMMPQVDEFLEGRERAEREGGARWRSLVGIDAHLPMLAMLELTALLLMILAYVFHQYVNREAWLLRELGNPYPGLARSPQMYLSPVLFIIFTWLVIVGIKAVVRLIRKVSRKRVDEGKGPGGLKVFVGIGLGAAGIMMFIAFNYFLFTDPKTAFLPFVAALMYSPLLLGILALLLRKRWLIPISLGATVLQGLLYRNGSEDLPLLLLFAILMVLYAEVMDSAIRFSLVYGSCIPHRDRHDALLLDDLVGRYLRRLILGIAAIAALSAGLFYSRDLASMILPDSVTRSVEFNSHLFFVMPLLMLLLAIVVIRRVGRRFLAGR